jgi:phage tail sheath gpL-like
MSRVIIPDRICSHCGGTKWIIEKENRKYGVITRYRCAIKASERYKRWEINNPDKVSHYSKQVNKRKTESGYWKTEEYKKKQLLKYYKDRDQVTDRFVKHRLAHDGSLSQSDIPQELVELKRKQILLIRELRNHEENKDSINQ